MSGESRMSKILKRLARKDKENQEPKKEKKSMSEYKDSKLGQKDLDFDLGDIAGEVSRDNIPASTQESKERPFDSLKKKTPLEPLKKTVEDHLGDAWICFIEDGKLEHRELKSCTAEEFSQWLLWVYPPSKGFLEKHLRLYDSYEKRETEFMNLIAFLTRLPKMFEQYGEKHVFPQLKGTTKKVGG